MKYYTTWRQLRLMLVLVLHFSAVVAAGAVLGWANGATVFGAKIGLILGSLFYIPMISWYAATLIYFLFWAGELKPQTATPTRVKTTGESQFIYTHTKSLEIYDGEKILHTQHVFFVSEATELLNKEVSYICKDRLIFILEVK